MCNRVLSKGLHHSLEIVSPYVNFCHKKITLRDYINSLIFNYILSKLFLEN